MLGRRHARYPKHSWHSPSWRKVQVWIDVSFNPCVVICVIFQAAQPVLKFWWILTESCAICKASLVSGYCSLHSEDHNIKYMFHDLFRNITGEKHVLTSTLKEVISYIRIIYIYLYMCAWHKHYIPGLYPRCSMYEIFEHIWTYWRVFQHCLFSGSI